MKSYKITVSDDKAKFFKDLLDNLGIAFFEVESTHEPRIYPATNFELRSKNVKAEMEKDKGTETKKASLQSRQESLQDVLRKIEEMRSNKK